VQGLISFWCKTKNKWHNC